MIFVLRVPLPAQHHRAGSREAAQVVHVAVRVVPGDPLPQPDHVRDAEERAKDLLHPLPGHPRVADLDLRVEQALLRRDQRSPPVDLDRSPLQNDALPVEPDRQELHAERLRGPCGDARVLSPVRVSRPRVEPEPGDAHFALRAFPADEDRAEVARPPAIGRKTEEGHAGWIDPDAGEEPERLRLVRLRRDDDPDDLAGGDHPRDLPVDPGDGRELSGPVGAVVRPADPGRLVRLPLRGHPETARRGQRPLPHGSSSRTRLVIPP